MKVIVLGSGVVGVTSAWYLARAGHDVHVVDRQAGPAAETSFANAGQVSPGYAAPWSAPGMPIKALRWLLHKNSPLSIKPYADLGMLPWLGQMLLNCTPRRYALNKARMLRLAEYSRDMLASLREETGISYDGGTLGTLQIFETDKQIDAIAKDTRVLASAGVPFETLDEAQCRAAEPGLARSNVPLAGGLLLPNDETGDCRKFTLALADLARQQGVRFTFDCQVQKLVEKDGRIFGLSTSQGVIAGDVYLLCAGSFSRFLLDAVGIRAPIYPVKGYSITIPIAQPAWAPRSTILDETYKIAITRLGDRIRVGGMAELSGYEITRPPAKRAILKSRLEALFPGASQLDEDDFWGGLRPMTPDGTPIIGSTKIGNLFTNAGHGTLGWTMACGSGAVIADIISRRAPEIETRDLAIARY